MKHCVNLNIDFRICAELSDEKIVKTILANRTKRLLIRMMTLYMMFRENPLTTLNVLMMNL